MGNETVLISKDAFHAIGLKWVGTFAEAGEGGIRELQTSLQYRLKEIPHVINPDILLGLSYHAKPDSQGFTHYAAVEVEKVDDIPSGMVSVFVPPLMYATCKHQKGQQIDRSYDLIYRWINNAGLEENNVHQLTHFEKYPMDQNPFTAEPEFTILIPVKRKG